MNRFAPLTGDSYIGRRSGISPRALTVHVGALAMARSNGGKAKAFFRANPSGAFDQYLQDIQKLPLIKDPAEERRLARRVQRGDERSEERRVGKECRYRWAPHDLKKKEKISKAYAHNARMKSV